MVRLEIGRIGRAHGLRGEVQVTLLTDRTERLAPGAVLAVGDDELVVAETRPHQSRWLVRFEGVDDRTAAEALRGRVLAAASVDDADNELWVHAVVGRVVREVDGTERGTVVAVQANPAHDLLVLDDDTLVPAVFITDESDPGVLVVDAPEGLFP